MDIRIKRSIRIKAVSITKLFPLIRPDLSKIPDQPLPDF
jgi:hypothetical protein